ncbi:hypothetical protein CNYM01_13046 [Colletotrichum nymphaeae SA-01]|uniref:Uncharacterized protein n=1 Tax=Colletotrichum nymphaeae SA-01 TaxID=1460502 RepID=A0A135STA2_9PEZI|nr:hypothetical protein CNYM01_13046 [Colletotrichum nymphaeae SA-01]
MALVMLNARAGQSCQVMVKGERYGTGPESGASPSRKWKEQEPSTDTTKLQQSEVQNLVVPEERAKGSFNGKTPSKVHLPFGSLPTEICPADREVWPWKRPDEKEGSRRMTLGWHLHLPTFFRPLYLAFPDVVPALGEDVVAVVVAVAAAGAYLTFLTFLVAGRTGQALTVVIALFCSKIGSGGRRKRRGKEASTAPAAGGRGSLPSFPISKALSIIITDMAFSIVDASCQPRALSNNPPTSLFPSPSPHKVREQLSIQHRDHDEPPVPLAPPLPGAAPS